MDMTTSNKPISSKSMAAAALVLTTVALSACGTTHTERGLSGGAIGAGAGAVGAAVVGGSVATGAIVGGVAGAAVGVLTDENDINLGD